MDLKEENRILKEENKILEEQLTKLLTASKIFLKEVEARNESVEKILLGMESFNKDNSSNMEKNISDYSMEELKEYITTETKGMNINDKFEFGRELIKRIEIDKRLNNKI